VPKGAKLKQTKFDRTQSDVDELLKEHASTIEALRVKLLDEPHYDAAVHDELFVLRFVLSNGAAKAEVPLRETIKWRHENAASLTEAATGVRQAKHDAMGKLSIADLLDVTTLQDEPILVVRTGRSNVKALMDAYTEDEVVEYLNYSKETAYARCDATTRRTRRLVKMITILDMAASKISGNDRRFMRALGRSSKEAEVHYPQLLALTVPVNPPAFVNLLWGVAKHFLPQRTLAKMRFCGARDTTRQSVAECPFAGRNFTADTLCTFLGGAMAPPQRLRVADVDDTIAM